MTEAKAEQNLAAKLYRAARMVGDGPANREAGLDSLRRLAVDHRSALLVLAVELAHDAPESFLPMRDAWAEAASRIGHHGPLLTLIAYRDMNGDTQGADLLRSRYRLAVGVETPGDDAVLQQAAGLIIAGGTHRDFGLKQLAELAVKGHQAAGLMLADELAENAPRVMRAGRQGWAEAAGQLGHMGPLLKLIVRGEQEGEPTQALRDIYVALVNLSASDVNAERTTSDASCCRASGETRKKNRKTVPDAKSKKTTGSKTIEPAKPWTKRFTRWWGEALPFLLAFGIATAGLELYEYAPVRDWFAANFSRLTSTEIESEASKQPSAILEVSLVSAPARAALTAWADRDEAEAGAALAAGKPREADDAIVRAIESALVASDFDHLDRLLDRQLQTANAIEVAKREDERLAAKEQARKNEIEYLLKSIVGYIQRGAEYRMEGSTDRAIIRAVSFKVSLDNSDLPCTLNTSQRYNTRNPEKILAHGPLPAWSNVDLYNLYRFEPNTFNPDFYYMVGSCPKYVLNREGILLSFCSRRTVDNFRSLLKRYLEITGCMR
jgi:hypothetical protein